MTATTPNRIPQTADKAATPYTGFDRFNDETVNDLPYSIPRAPIPSKL
jgi:hypothetical protein